MHLHVIVLFSSLYEMVRNVCVCVCVCVVVVVVVVVVIVVVGRAKRAPHWGVQSRFRVIYMCVCACVCRMSN